MNEQDKKSFAELMVGNGEIHNKEISKSLMQTYFDVLKAYTIEEVKHGFSRHTLDPIDGKFFPKPANIIKHLEASQLTTEQKAELAWGQIEREIRATGSWGTLKLDDKQALAALKSFTSWKDLCNMETTKMTWAKKEFMSMYCTYENTPIDMLPSSLPGRVDLVGHKQESARSLKNIMDGMSNYRAKLENN